MTPDLDRLRKALKVFREFEKTLRLWQTTQVTIQRGVHDHVRLLRGSYPVNERMSHVVDIRVIDFRELAYAADAVLGEEANHG